MTDFKYDDITIGTVISENELEKRNRQIHDNSLVAVPTGKTSLDGSLEYIILSKQGSTSYINGKPQGTVFGSDLVISKETPQISGKWDVGINLLESNADIVSTGYVKVTDDESTLEIGTGIALDGSIVFTSLKRIRYEPGTPIYAKFTLAFPDETDSNGDYVAGIGLGEGFGADDSGIGIYQRRLNNVFDYGVILVRKGVVNFYPFNGVMPDNPQNLIIYRIEWGYLGSAPLNVYWRNVDQEKWTRMHRRTFNQKITSVTKPDLPVCGFITNQGNTANVALFNGSYEAGTINGGSKFDPAARIGIYERAFTAAPGTNVLIFAFRNPINVDMYDGIDITGIPSIRTFKNSIASQLLQVGINVFNNNKLVDIDLYIVPTEDLIDGTFTAVELGYSVLEVSEDVTPVLTNARKIEPFVRSKDEARTEEITTLDLLFPGFTAIFVYSTTSVAFDFSAFIKFQDLF